MRHWEIRKVIKSLDDKEVVSIEVVDKKYRDASVSFKWDGCINYHKYENGYTVDDEYSEDRNKTSQYIHICDINDMIEKLQEIKKIAEEHFSKDNYREYWNEQNE